MSLLRVMQGLMGTVTTTGDPFFANVVTLLHFDGANGSTTFTDQIGRVWSSVNGAALSTANPKFSQNLLLDGTNDRVTTPDSNDFNFGTGDFTIEGWVWVNTLVPTQQFILCQRSGFASNHALSIIVRTDSSILYQTSLNGSTIIQTPSPIGITINNWHFFAVVRNGANLLCSLDGVFGAPMNVGASALFNSTALFQIGASNPGGTPAEFLNGRIDDLRITKGVCRYTGNFVPPIAPFPNGP